MAKMVGLSRPLKTAWLNKVVELQLSGKSEAEIKNELNEYLAFEIGSAINIRKTREIYGCGKMKKIKRFVFWH